MKYIAWMRSYLHRRLTSGEGIVSLAVRLSRCHAVCVRGIILGGKGNVSSALWLILGYKSGFVVRIAWIKIFSPLIVHSE